MRKSNLFPIICYIFVMALLSACGSDVDITMPKGPKGDSGLSAYEFWKEQVTNGTLEWPKDKVGVADYFAYIKGEKGDKGDDGLSSYELWKNLIASGNIPNPHDPQTVWPANKNSEVDYWDFLTGRDGLTPHVGTNGNWYIGDKDTGVKAAGKDGLDGKDGLSAYELWVKSVADGSINWPKDKTDMNEFFLYLKGKDGLTPYVGTNGNWWIGNKDTGLKAKGEDGKDGVDGTDGKDGADGAAGLSAYELWVEDVKKGNVHDKANNVWPQDKISKNDFYTYLTGANGKDGLNGKSAYELWKEMAAAGKVDDPKNEGKKWPANQVAENDFFRFLTGKDGMNGKDGKSAYELWKEDLAKRCGTNEAMTDHRNGGVWDCEKNTLNDFYEYLRGADGKDGEDGKDGKPGEPGKPGAEVTIIKGVPNVIAQYSQSEFGEYVRTTDGGVLYKVYDEQGQIAPGAKVKGMPGILATKEYTADSKGEFIVPKEDLPEIQDVNLRWGTVKQVTLNGKAPQESAKNTYVPNRVRMRMILQDNSNSLSNYQYLYFYIQRKMNPEDEWQKIPSYLPNSASRALDAYRVADKNSPQSIQMNQKLYSNYSYSSSSGAYYYYIYTYRFVQENPGKFKNNQATYWDGSDVYYTVKARDTYYGESIQWNGVCLLAPYQMGPLLKKLKLKGISSGTEASFASAEGEFDFSRIDFTRIYKSSTKRTVLANGMDYVEPVAYTEQEARNLKMAYVSFSYTSSAGNQNASSSNNKSSVNAPTFKVYAPFLNSTVYISSDYECYFYRFYQGYLKKGTAPNTYVVSEYNSSYEFPQVEVTYEN